MGISEVGVSQALQLGIKLFVSIGRQQKEQVNSSNCGLVWVAAI
jgi:hypothetical protein